MAIILHLPVESEQTPEEVLRETLEIGVKNIVCIGFDADGDWFLRTSKMSRQDALWVAEKLRDWAIKEQ